MTASPTRRDPPSDDDRTLDIHANLEALEAVLREVDERKPDQILCLGDVVGYGASPNECLDLVRARCKTVLLGNHDAAASGGPEAARVQRLRPRRGRVDGADAHAEIGNTSRSSR